MFCLISKFKKRIINLKLKRILLQNNIYNHSSLIPFDFCIHNQLKSYCIMLQYKNNYNINNII
jgi:hypothetical protein